MNFKEKMDGDPLVDYGPFIPYSAAFWSSSLLILSMSMNSSM